MVSSVTIKRYISQLDEVILSGDVSAAEELQEEVLSVLGPSFKGLKAGLTNYGPYMAATIAGKTTEVFTPVDYIKDARIPETLILHKKDGTVAEVTALVDGSKIFSDDAHLNIEESDIYERTLPSGGKEYYRIKDRGFYKGDHGIPDNYQSKVEKITEKEAGRELSRSAPEGKPHKLFISHTNFQ